MLSINTTPDALGVTTLVLIAALSFFSLFCIAYVLYFRLQIRRGRLFALEDFNAVWVIRILLILCGMLWGLAQLLRLPVLRHEGAVFHGLSSQHQAALCRAHTVLSFGVMEPCFFLTALFLVQGSLRDAPFPPPRKWNQKTISLVLMCCLPVLSLQLFFVVFDSKMSADDKLLGLPSYFTRSFIRESHAGSGTTCTFPLMSTLVLGLFSCIYSCFFLWQGHQMAALIINKRLRFRVCGLVLSLAVLLPVQVLFMGLSVISLPGNILFDILDFVSFVATLLCILIGEGMLVVQPIADAMAVKWFFNPAPRGTRQVTFDSFSMSLVVFGNEEDASPCPLIKGSQSPQPLIKGSANAAVLK